MFENQELLAEYYAVRYNDDAGNTLLMQGKKGIQLFTKNSRANKALEKLGCKGEVIRLKLNEVGYSVPETKIDVSGIQATLTDITQGLGKAHSVDLYKCRTVMYGGTNVIRHTPLGKKPVRVPGDLYTDIELNLQIRINH